MERGNEEPGGDATALLHVVVVAPRAVVGDAAVPLRQLILIDNAAGKSNP